MRLFLTFLLLSFILTNCPTENDPNLVDITTSVNPEGAGVVNPPEGTYEIGRQVAIETEANEDRWEFAGWSGDTTASDDSLTFEISRNMNLIANYEIPSDEQPVLATTVEPAEAGTVEPDSGQFEFGSSIDVEAIPEEGWGFSEWSGDTSATDNPLTITMNKDYNLTANFTELSNTFSNQITVSDSINSMDLTFGMDADATAGFDSGIDRELPPPPPEGSFYGQFNIPDFNLAEDYRAIRNEPTIWELEVTPDSGQTISLSWDFSDTDHLGSLTLTDDPEDPSFEVDMKSDTTHQASDEPVQLFYIISQHEN